MEQSEKITILQSVTEMSRFTLVGNMKKKLDGIIKRKKVESEKRLLRVSTCSSNLVANIRVV